MTEEERLVFVTILKASAVNAAIAFTLSFGYYTWKVIQPPVPLTASNNNT